MKLTVSISIETFRVLQVFCGEMFIKRLTLFSLLWNLNLNAAFKSRSDLHFFMDKDELKFFFGTDSVDDLPDYEIVNLPENLSNGRESVLNDDDHGDQIDYGKQVSFKVFEKQIDLNLFPNKNILSPYTKIVKKFSNGTEKLLKNERNACHYLHANNKFTAAVSNCEPTEVHGIIFLGDDTLEILPLNARLRFVLFLKGSLVDGTRSGINKIPHLVKRSTLDVDKFGSFENDFVGPKYREPSSTSNENEAEISQLLSGLKETISQQMPRQRGFDYDQPVVELGAFFDEAFYKIFAPFFNYDDEKMRNLILSYINGVQSLYHHSSLERRIDFTIVYLEIMAEQSKEMPHAYGERNALLDSFCSYQKSLNPGDDRNPKHWDMAIYVSGLDFFAFDQNGSKSGVTMGLATVGGVCLEDYNCIIAEFGSVNHFGRPYPSAGFTSVYILAHEIGHNLGMSHDSVGNSCSKDGFVMSPSRGTQGETTWSSCSAKNMKKLDWAKCLYDRPVNVSSNLDAWKYEGYPGITYTSKDQCEILLRDREAYPFVNGPQSSVCENLHCRTPNKSGFFFAGPALSGTDCGTDMWCDSGSCVKKTALDGKPEPIWGPWQSTRCKSECIQRSQGRQINTRHCNSAGSPLACEGHSYSVTLCNDERLCRKRKTVAEYGTAKCKEFNEYLPHIDPNGIALQAPYQKLRLWMSCAIFCKHKDTGSYYTPRIELNDLGISSYYPDGTLCHSESNEDYYCLQNHCLPESTKFSKSSLHPLDREDSSINIFHSITDNVNM